MSKTEFTSHTGATIRIIDPREPGSTEWDDRQRKIEKAVADFSRRREVTKK